MSFYRLCPVHRNSHYLFKISCLWNETSRKCVPWRNVSKTRTETSTNILFIINDISCLPTKKIQYEIKTWYFAFMVTFSTLITIKLTINLYYIIWFYTIYDMLHDTFIYERWRTYIFFFWKFLQAKFDRPTCLHLPGPSKINSNQLPTVI